MTDKKYLAIDPGLRTGYAWFDAKGKPVENGEIEGHDKFMDWLEDEPVPEMIIYETYRNRPWEKANVWADNKTSQLIGMILRYIYKNKIKVETSEPANLYVGLRFLGMYTQYAPRRGRSRRHVPNQLSALAHGVFVLQKLRIRQHEVPEKQ